MRAFEAVGPALRAAGVEEVFGLMGDGNLKFLSCFGGVGGPAFYGTRHENSALAMAIGYARSTGRAGVCTVTQGPGLANALTGIRAAVMARAPVVVIAGSLPAGSQRHIQYMDHDALFRVAGAYVEAPSSSEDVAAALLRAVARATRDRCVVGISLALDLQAQSWSGDVPATVALEDEPQEPALDGDELAHALALVAGAQRPVVLAGYGAVVSSARPQLEALGDRLGAVLATTLLANGMFAGHPYDVGVAGGFSSPGTARLLGEADVLLAFGASLNEWTLGHGSLFSSDLDIVQCDVDESQLAIARPVSCRLLGDAGAVASTLLEGAGPPREGYRAEYTALDVGTARSAEDVEDRSSAEAMDPRALFRALDAMLPPERTVATDGGHFLGFTVQGLTVPEPRGFLFGSFFGAVGLGMGGAMGGVIGRPQHLAVAVIGDGGMMMTLGDLETAVRYLLPVLVVVVNDAAYGAELHMMDLLELPSDEARFADVGFAEAAQALGATGFVVRRVEDLVAVQSWLDAPSGPCVLDCKITTEVRAPWLEGVVRASAPGWAH